MELRTIDASERESVLDLLGEWEGESRAHFARYFAHDPTYRDDLCFVAVDDHRVVSTLQVFRKRVRFGAATVDVAGVGNVFTAATHRERGLSTALLERALAEMPRRGFALSLLFATRILFYARLGWEPVVRSWSLVRAASPSPCSNVSITRFTPADLPAVAAIYDRYCASLTGTTVRSAKDWTGHLRTAGQLDEDILVAHHAGRIVAYARATRLYDLDVITEHGCVEGGDDAVAMIIASRVAELGGSGLVAQLTIAPRVAAALAAAGCVCESLDDSFWMWRVVDAPALAAQLGVSENEVLRPGFLARLLPAAASVYWISDRF